MLPYLVSLVISKQTIKTEQEQLLRQILCMYQNQ